MSAHELSPATISPLLITQNAARERQGTLLVVLGGLILATMGVFVIQAAEDPITTVAFRCAFGCLSLLVWGALTRRLPELRLRGADLLGAVATGFLMTLSWALHFAAIPKTSIGVSTVVFHIQPFWTMALGAWLLRENVSSAQIVAALLAFAGLVLTTGLFDGMTGAATLNSSYVTGLLLSLAGSFVYAGVPLLAKILKSVSSFALSWWQCLVGSAFTLWWPAVYGWPDGWHSITWLVGLGAIHTGLAYAVMYAGFARLSTGRIAVLQFVYPMTAFIIDWQVYDHRLSPIQILGLVLMGVAIWSVKGAKPMPSAEAADRI
ncbi:DMT family transporter [Shinella zoogloeoides]|uniref:DMT family transporter n=1 Tax=Shinella zoogloeoides TaxID=352475 RepID=UPI00299E31FF|nr:DMT family transporter [Shinella zoogloeoides]WPE24274.1 hypothetical protein ShzoTeo12_54970 [Shinella zoogloeoides]